jgi:16S rRNA (adenine1518-N6/adenine1519-N6)-dimethyltransferase
LNKISKLKNNKPLKKFGQNYLVDKNIVLKFVNRFNPSTDDHVIEIGPGRGAITEELATRTKHLTAIEIDNRIIDELTDRFPNVNFVHKDILKIDFEAILKPNVQYRVMGNIPFNLTSPIFFKLIKNRSHFLDAMFIIQLEVAQRIVANPNTKNYGILSVILNYFADVNLEFEISPNVFYPKPKVKSAVIKLDFTKTLDDNINAQLFIDVVKASFGNRRKTLKNSLNNSIFKSCNFLGIDLDLSRRAESFAIDDFIQLTQFIQEKKCYGREQRRNRS